MGAERRGGASFGGRVGAPEGWAPAFERLGAGRGVKERTRGENELGAGRRARRVERLLEGGEALEVALRAAGELRGHALLLVRKVLRGAEGEAGSGRRASGRCVPMRRGDAARKRGARTNWKRRSCSATMRLALSDASRVTASALARSSASDLSNAACHSASCTSDSRVKRSVFSRSAARSRWNAASLAASCFTASSAASRALARRRSVCAWAWAASAAAFAAVSASCWAFAACS